MMMLAACSSDDDDFVDEEKSEQPIYEEVIIGAGLPVNDGTRVSVDDLNLSWQKNDQLVITTVFKGTLAEVSEFTIMPETIQEQYIEGKRYSRAKFKGNLIINAEKYNVYYKAEKLNVDKEKITAAIDYSDITQNGIGSQEHIAKYLDMSLFDVTGTDLTGLNLNLNINTSILRINVKSLPESIANASKVTWKVNKFEGTHLAETKDIATLNFNGNIVSGNDNYLEIPFSPAGVSFDPADEFCLEFTDGTHTGTVKTGMQKHITYKNGHRYNVIVVADKNNSDAHTLHDWDI